MDGRNVLHAVGVPRLAREAQLASLRLGGRLFGAPRPTVATDRLRILACTPTYLPDARRGAEITLHVVLRDLVRRGHEARVLRTLPGPVPERKSGPVPERKSGRDQVVDGVEVHALGPRRRTRELCEWSDVIVGQLDARGLALRLGARFRRPVVYWMHIGNVDRRALYGSPDLTVFASATVRQQYPWITPAIVVHPPISEHEYLTTPGDAITLVDFSASKGARVFGDLARRLPDRPFLTIASGPERPAPAANVTTLAAVDDMRVVFTRTRILLMPSAYESYGRVGVEAAASGIPTIAHPAAGIREALGDAAVFVDRQDIDGWVSAIERLDEPAEYARRSARARARFESLDASSEIDGLDARLRELASSKVMTR
jgi:hypothetical protein